MSDSSRFSGTFSTTGPFVLINYWRFDMPTIVLSRDLTTTDVGSHTWTMTFTQNSVSVTASFSATITSGTSQSVPTAVSVAPASGTFPDNATAGTTVTDATITMSDGSTFSGTFSAVDETGAAAPLSMM